MLNRRFFLAAAPIAVAGMAAAHAGDAVSGVSGRKKMKPILIVMTSHGDKDGHGKTGYYLSEVTHPLSVFDAAGLPVVLASIKGGNPPVDGLELTDRINARYWNDTSFRERVSHTMALADADPKDYSAIFYPGGHGAMWDFPVTKAVNTFTRAIWEQGGIVGAVCHGPAALTNVTLSNGDPLVRGRTVSAFSDAEERAVGMDHIVPFLLSDRLAKLGAKLHTGPNWSDTTSVDGRLVTGQNPQSATSVGRKMAALLKA